MNLSDAEDAIGGGVAVVRRRLGMYYVLIVVRALFDLFYFAFRCRDFGFLCVIKVLHGVYWYLLRSVTWFPFTSVHPFGFSYVAVVLLEEIMGVVELGGASSCGAT